MPADRRPTRDEIALRFHETYERLAPSFGYETRAETRAFDPDTPNGRLMIAVCGEVTDALFPPASEGVRGSEMKDLAPNRATDPAAMRGDPTPRPETAALLARVEALGGPDREVDYELHDMAWGNWLRERGARRDGDGWWLENPRIPGSHKIAPPQDYTDSLDAALALVERVRPGWWGNIEWGDRARATVFELHVRSFSGEGATPALALLAALLRSLTDTARSPDPDATRQDGRREG